ncbi:MAG: hypothetical protein MMC33_000398 [Icmadophila ericetorum]|nr:hypothetical protein [Icmadophila ericetorum]
MASSAAASPVGAQAEGGATKGSTSAVMQSQLIRQQTMERADAEVAAKLDSALELITSDDASYAQSREAKATGIAHPAGGNNNFVVVFFFFFFLSSGGQLDPATQSQLDREANSVEVADKVQSKKESDPGSVTEEEANTLHRRE